MMMAGQNLEYQNRANPSLWLCPLHKGQLSPGSVSTSSTQSPQQMDQELHGGEDSTPEEGAGGKAEQLIVTHEGDELLRPRVHIELKHEIARGFPYQYGKTQMLTLS